MRYKEMQYKERKEALLKGIESIRKTINDIPDPKEGEDFSSGTIVMVAVETEEDQQVITVGEQVGDAIPIRGIIAQCLIENAASSYIELNMSITEYISMFTKMFRTDSFTKEVMRRIEKKKKAEGSRKPGDPSVGKSTGI